MRVLIKWLQSLPDVLNPVSVLMFFQKKWQLMTVTLKFWFSFRNLEALNTVIVRNPCRYSSSLIKEMGAQIK